MMSRLSKWDKAIGFFIANYVAAQVLLELQKSINKQVLVSGKEDNGLCFILAVVLLVGFFWGLLIGCAVL